MQNNKLLFIKYDLIFKELKMKFENYLINYYLKFMQFRHIYFMIDELIVI